MRTGLAAHRSVTRRWQAAHPQGEKVTCRICTVYFITSRQSTACPNCTKRHHLDEEATR